MAFSCQLEYTETISEQLSPFYLQLYDAVSLFLDGKPECKPKYEELIEEAMFELNHFKSQLEKEKKISN
jgi:hypothetical protein